MSVSKRISIAWKGGPAYEDTDTLVLTGRKYFVDVRIRNDPSLSLDWALAGTKTSMPGEREGETECTWSHTVDSRSSTPGLDYGTVIYDASDPLRAIERGCMFNPASGVEESYEEVWLDEVVPPGTLVTFFEKEDGSVIVGAIGRKKFGVGRVFAWRMEGGEVVYSVGDGLEGMDLPVDETCSEGEKISDGNWIVRESWQTT